MADDGPSSPLKRRVPGATGAGPGPSERKVLPDDLIARMQAAVDAAHRAQGVARAAAAAEPVTEPMPRLQAAVAAQDWPTVGSPNGAGQRGDAWNFRLDAGRGSPRSGGLTVADDDDALDDLAESYLVADPDLTAGFADEAWLDDPGQADQTWHRRWHSRTVTTSGWPALGHDGEPGTDVRHERAAWWDHAVQSGRVRPARSARARKRIRLAAADTQETAPAPAPSPAPSPTLPPPRPPKPESTLKPERERGPAAALGIQSITKPDSTGKPERPVTPSEPKRAFTAPVGQPDKRSREPKGAAVPGLTSEASEASALTPPEGERDKHILASTASPPAPPAGQRGRRSGRAMVGAVALAVVLVGGGVVAAALVSHDNAADRKVARSNASKEARIRAEARLAAAVVADAATWIVGQVNHATKVACDPAMCQALADHGFPDQGLDQLVHRAASTSSATILVDTPATRLQFGINTAASLAPTVLAGFGVGADQVMVRVLAPHGAQAYEAALRTDWKQRQLVGASLLTSSQIMTTKSARSALAAGDVDDRLLLVITALASQNPIDIVAFSQSWPGASPGTPMRCAYIADTDPAAHLTEPVYVQAMTDLLRAQPSAYRPVQFGLVQLGGRKVLSIWYPAPSPLGLISPGQ